MSEQGPAFRRILVELSAGHRDEKSLGFLTEVAGAYDVEMCGRYIVDPRPLQAAALPFNREFSMLEQAWRPLDQDALAHAAELSAAAARRRFERVADAHGVLHSFQMKMSAEPEAPERARRLESILALGPAWEKALPPEAVLQAAFEEAAGVLLLPSPSPREEGAVVVIAEKEDNELWQIGARFASHTKRELVVLEPERPGGRGLEARGGGQLGQIGRMELAGHRRERLIIARRNLLDATSLAVLATRRKAAVFAVDLPPA